MRLVYILFVFPILSFAQIAPNSSFEASPAAGVPPPGWKACNLYSTPDTQPGYWGVNLPPAHGNTYVSLFNRGIGGYINDGFSEAMGAQLLTPLKARTCYTFSIQLAFFPQATFFGSFGEVVSYDSPGVLNVWTGNSECSKEVLIFRSAPVTNQNWEKISFSYTPPADYNFIVLEIDYATSVKTFGNLLVDDLAIESASFSLGNDLVSCEGRPVQLSVSDHYDAVWSTGSTDNTITVSNSGTYAVTVKSAGCSLSDEIRIDFLPPISFELPNDTTLCPGDELRIDLSSVAGVYHWEDGVASPSRTITQPGRYKVMISNGCFQHEDEIVVSIPDHNCCYLAAPNIFTPNNDGFNDAFVFDTGRIVTDLNLQIFNRWGKEVFRTTSISGRWDGQNNDSNAATGVYFWVASLNCKNNGAHRSYKLRGSLTLTR